MTSTRVHFTLFLAVLASIGLFHACSGDKQPAPSDIAEVTETEIVPWDSGLIDDDKKGPNKSGGDPPDEIHLLFKTDGGISELAQKDSVVGWLFVDDDSGDVTEFDMEADGAYPLSVPEATTIADLFGTDNEAGLKATTDEADGDEIWSFSESSSEDDAGLDIFFFADTASESGWRSLINDGDQSDTVLNWVVLKSAVTNDITMQSDSDGVAFADIHVLSLPEDTDDNADFEIVMDPSGMTPAMALVLKTTTVKDEYTVVVRATDADGNEYDETFTFERVAYPPEAPHYITQAPTATPLSAHSASLTWNSPEFDGNSAVTGYRITIRVNEKGDWLEHTADTESTDTEATLEGLMGDTEYRFKVAAINDEGVGPDSLQSNLVQTLIDSGPMWIRLSNTVVPSNAKSGDLVALALPYDPTGVTASLTGQAGDFHQLTVPLGTTPASLFGEMNQGGLGSADSIDDADLILSFPENYALVNNEDTTNGEPERRVSQIYYGTESGWTDFYDGPAVDNKIGPNVVIARRTNTEFYPQGPVDIVNVTMESGVLDNDSFSLETSLDSVEFDAFFLVLAEDVDSDQTTEYKVRLKATDANGDSFAQDLTLSVADLVAPTSVVLTNNSLKENAPPGSIVGLLLPQDAQGGLTQLMFAPHEEKMCTVPEGTTLGDLMGEENEAGVGGGKSTESADVITSIASDGSLTTYFWNSGFGGEGWRSPAADTFEDQKDAELAQNVVIRAKDMRDLQFGSTIDTHTLSLTDDASDNASFGLSKQADGSLNGMVLVTKESLDYGTKSQYNLVVRATDASGLSTDQSLTVNVEEVASSPADVVGSAPTATAESAVSVKLTWAEPIWHGGEPITGYRIWMQTSGVGEYDVVVSSTGTDTTSATVTGLHGETVYRFKVAATNSVGVADPSPPSNSVTTPTNMGTHAVLVTNNQVVELAASGTYVGQLFPRDKHGSFDSITTTVKQRQLTVPFGTTVAKVFGKTNQAGLKSADKATDADRVVAHFSSGAKSVQFYYTAASDCLGGCQPTGWRTSAGADATDLVLEHNITLMPKGSGQISLSTEVDEHAVVLVDGVADNAAFKILSQKGLDKTHGFYLHTNDTFDCSVQCTYTIRVKVTDGDGAEREHEIPIKILDTAAPSDILISSSNILAIAGSDDFVGLLFAKDDYGSLTSTPVGNDAHFALTVPANTTPAGLFGASNSAGLTVWQSFSMPADAVLSYTSTAASDGAPPSATPYFYSQGAWYSYSQEPVSENSAVVGDGETLAHNVIIHSTQSKTLSFQTPVDTHSFELVGIDNDNDKFQIGSVNGQFSGMALRTASGATFDPYPATYTIDVRATDGNGLQFDKSITLQVALPTAPHAIIDAPAAWATSATSVALSWDPPASDGGTSVTGYKISVSAGLADFTELVSNTGSDTMSYVVTEADGDVDFDLTLRFKVAGINSVGVGPDSPASDEVLTSEFPPVHKAKSVSFTDTDVDYGELSGLVAVERADDESDVSKYVLYWGISATQRMPMVLFSDDPIMATEFGTTQFYTDCADEMDKTLYVMFPSAVDQSTSMGGALHGESYTLLPSGPYSLCFQGSDNCLPGSYTFTLAMVPDEDNVVAITLQEGTPLMGSEMEIDITTVHTVEGAPINDVKATLGCEEDVDLNQDGPSSSYLEIGEDLAPDGFWSGYYAACGEDGNEGSVAGITGGGYVGRMYGPVNLENSACSAGGGSVIDHVFLRDDYGGYILEKADGTGLLDGYYRVPERADDGQGFGKGPANWGLAPEFAEEALEIKIQVEWSDWDDDDIFLVGSYNGLKADGLVLLTGGPPADDGTISMYVPLETLAGYVRIYAVTFKDNDVTSKPTHYGNTGDIEIVIFEEFGPGEAAEVTVDFGTEGVVPSPPFAVLPKPAEGSDDLTYAIPPNSEMDPWYGASHILVYTRNAAGEMTTGVATEVEDLVSDEVPDTQGPTALLSTATNPTNSSPITVAISFNEPVLGFQQSDLVLTNAQVNSWQSTGSSSYDLSITPDAEGIVTISLPADSVTDASDNANTAAELEITYDGTAPTVSLVQSEAIAAPGTIGVTATFTEGVCGLLSVNIGVENGTVSDLVGQGGCAALPGCGCSTYDFVVTPDGDGLVTLYLGAGAAQDGAGNDNEAAQSLTVFYDGQPPSVTVTAPQAVKGAFDATVTFDEAVCGFDQSSLGVNNGLVTQVTGQDGCDADPANGACECTQFTVAISPDGAGALTLSVEPNEVSDSAGNTNQASMPVTVGYDTTAPSVMLLSDTMGSTSTSPINITIGFNEDVVGFEAGDVVVINGSAGTFQATNPSNYTLEILPASAGTVSVDVPLGSAQDIAGNDNDAAQQLQISYDNQAPEITAGPTVTPQETSLSVSVTVDEAGSVVCKALADGADAPTALQMQSGGFTSPAQANTAVTVTITGLSAGTAYELYCYTRDGHQPANGMDTDEIAATHMNTSTIDNTAPAFTTGYPSASADETSVEVTGQMNEAGTLWCLALSAGTSEPTPAQVKADGESVSVKAANQSYTIDLDGLPANASYDVYCYGEDDEDSPNGMSQGVVTASKQQVSTSADTEAPVFSEGPALSATKNTIKATLQLNEAGTVWCHALSAGSTTPSAASVKSNGTSQTVSSGGSAATVTLTSLSEETVYDVYCYAEDGTSNATSDTAVAATKQSTSTSACDNNVQDGDETNIDCGGSCDDCPGDNNDACDGESSDCTELSNDWFGGLLTDVTTEGDVTNEDCQTPETQPCFSVITSGTLHAGPFGDLDISGTVTQVASGDEVTWCFETETDEEISDASAGGLTLPTVHFKSCKTKTESGTYVINTDISGKVTFSGTDYDFTGTLTLGDSWSMSVTLKENNSDADVALNSWVTLHSVTLTIGQGKTDFTLDARVTLGTGDNALTLEVDGDWKTNGAMSFKLKMANTDTWKPFGGDWLTIDDMSGKLSKLVSGTWKVAVSTDAELSMDVGDSDIALDFNTLKAEIATDGKWRFEIDAVAELGSLGSAHLQSIKSSTDTSPGKVKNSVSESGYPFEGCLNGDTEAAYAGVTGTVEVTICVNNGGLSLDAGGQLNFKGVTLSVTDGTYSKDGFGLTVEANNLDLGPIGTIASATGTISQTEGGPVEWSVSVTKTNFTLGGVTFPEFTVSHFRSSTGDNSTTVSGEINVLGQSKVNFSGTLTLGASWTLTLGVGNISLGTGLTLTDTTLTITQATSTYSLSAGLKVGSGDDALQLSASGTYANTGDLTLNATMQTGTLWKPFGSANAGFSGLSGTLTRTSNAWSVAATVTSSFPLSLGSGFSVDVTSFTATWSSGSWSFGFTSTTELGALGEVGLGGSLTYSNSNFSGCLNTNLSKTLYGVSLSNFDAELCAGGGSVTTSIAGKVTVFGKDFTIDDGSLVKTDDKITIKIEISDLELASGLTLTDVTLSAEPGAGIYDLEGTLSVGLGPCSSDSTAVCPTDMTVTGKFKGDGNFSLTVSKASGAWQPFPDPYDLTFTAASGKISRTGCPGNCNLTFSLKTTAKSGEYDIVTGFTVSDVFADIRYNQSKGAIKVGLGAKADIEFGENTSLSLDVRGTWEDGDLSFSAAYAGNLEPLKAVIGANRLVFKNLTFTIDITDTGKSVRFDTNTALCFKTGECSEDDLFTVAMGGAVSSDGNYGARGSLQSFALPGFGTIQNLAVGVASDTYADFDLWGTPDNSDDDVDLPKGVTLAAKLLGVDLDFSFMEDTTEYTFLFTIAGLSAIDVRASLDNGDTTLFDNTDSSEANDFDKIGLDYIKLSSMSFVGSIKGPVLAAGFEASVDFKPDNQTNELTGTAQITVDTTASLNTTLYINGVWYSPFGIDKLAVKNPAVTLGITPLLVPTSLGFNTDIYWLQDDDDWPDLSGDDTPDNVLKIGGSLYLDKTPTESGLCLIRPCASLPPFMARLDIQNLDLGLVINAINDLKGALRSTFGFEDALPATNFSAVTLDDATESLGLDFNIDRLFLYVSTHNMTLWDLKFRAGAKAILDASIMGNDLLLEGQIDTSGILLQGRMSPISFNGGRFLQAKIVGDPFRKTCVSGDTGYIEVDDDDRLHQTTGLWEGWARTETWPQEGAEAAILMSQWSAQNGYRISIGEANEEGVAHVLVDFRNNYNMRVFKSIDAVVEPSVWTHIAINHSGKDIGLVVNGNPVSVAIGPGSDPPEIGPGDCNCKLIMGKGIDEVDDLRIWKATRKPSQLAAESLDLPMGYEKDADLVARYECDFDDPSETTAHNTRYYATDPKLSGTFKNDANAQLVVDDNDIYFKLGMQLNPEGSNGLFLRSGIQLDVPIADYQFVGTTQVGIGDGDASGYIYVPEFTFFTIPTLGKLRLGGDGPNLEEGDFDDGAYAGFDLKQLSLAATLDLLWKPDDENSEAKSFAGATLSFKCPDGETCKNALSHELDVTATVNLTAPIPGCTGNKCDFGIIGAASFNSGTGILALDEGTFKAFGEELLESSIQISKKEIDVDTTLDLKALFGSGLFPDDDDSNTISIGMNYQYSPPRLCGEVDIEKLSIPSLSSAGTFDAHIKTCWGSNATLELAALAEDMDFALFEVNKASLNYSSITSNFDLEIDMDLPFGSVKLDGYYNSYTDYKLEAEADLIVAGYTMAGADILFTNDQIAIDGTISLGGANVVLSGALDGYGSWSLSGTADLSFGNVDLAGAKVTINNNGVFIEANLDFGPLKGEISGWVKSDGTFSLAGKGSVKINGVNMADADVSLSSATGLQADISVDLMLITWDLDVDCNTSTKICTVTTALDMAGAVEFNGLISLSPNQFSMAGTLKAGPIETAVSGSVTGAAKVCSACMVEKTVCTTGAWAVTGEWVAAQCGKAQVPGECCEGRIGEFLLEGSADLTLPGPGNTSHTLSSVEVDLKYVHQPQDLELKIKGTVDIDPILEVVVEGELDTSAGTFSLEGTGTVGVPISTTKTVDMLAATVTANNAGIKVKGQFNFVGILTAEIEGELTANGSIHLAGNTTINVPKAGGGSWPIAGAELDVMFCKNTTPTFCKDKSTNYAHITFDGSIDIDIFEANLSGSIDSSGNFQVKGDTELQVPAPGNKKFKLADATVEVTFCKVPSQVTGHFCKDKAAGWAKAEAKGALQIPGNKVEVSAEVTNNNWEFWATLDLSIKGYDLANCQVTLNKADGLNIFAKVGLGDAIQVEIEGTVDPSTKSFSFSSATNLDLVSAITVDGSVTFEGYPSTNGDGSSSYIVSFTGKGEASIGSLEATVDLTIQTSSPKLKFVGTAEASKKIKYVGTVTCKITLKGQSSGFDGEFDASCSFPGLGTIGVSIDVGKGKACANFGWPLYKECTPSLW